MHEWPVVCRQESVLDGHSLRDIWQGVWACNWLRLCWRTQTNHIFHGWFCVPGVHGQPDGIVWICPHPPFLSFWLALDRYKLLIKHHFASHVIQILLTVASNTVAHEVCLSCCKETRCFWLSYIHQSRGILLKLEDSSNKGELHTLT